MGMLLAQQRRGKRCGGWRGGCELGGGRGSRWLRLRHWCLLRCWANRLSCVAFPLGAERTELGGRCFL